MTLQYVMPERKTQMTLAYIVQRQTEYFDSTCLWIKMLFCLHLLWVSSDILLYCFIVHCVNFDTNDLVNQRFRVWFGISIQNQWNNQKVVANLILKKILLKMQQRRIENCFLLNKIKGRIWTVKVIYQNQCFTWQTKMRKYIQG